jgi:hypothetical protein
MELRRPLLRTRIDTALSSQLALKRIREAARSDGEPIVSPAGRRAFGKVDGLRFTVRRSAVSSTHLHGELAGIVVPRDDGSTIRARAMGSDWAAMYAGAGLAAAVFFTLLLRDATDSAEQFVFIVIGACCLGASLFVVGGIFADWRFLMRHLHDLFEDVMP